MSLNETVILAGGVGSRLRGVIADRPKPMADVAGRPFLAYILDHVAACGGREVVLSVGYKHEMISDHFGEHYRDLRLRYCVERERLGTGGGVKLALGVCRDDQVLVLNGDTLFRADYGALAAAHREHDARLTLGLKAMDDCGRYGRVELDDAGRVTGFLEKQAQVSGLINAGVYVMQREWYLGLPTPAVFSFEQDVMEPGAAEGGFWGVASDAYFIDIGIPEDYARAQRELPALGRSA